MSQSKWKASMQTCLSEIDHDFLETEPPKLVAIIYAEFDNDIGRVMRYQVPNEVFSKARFDSISSAIIPSEEMRDRMIKINMYDYKILGHPVGIRDSEKYPREFFIFNMCFVVANESRDDAMFEPLVQKCAEYLIELETERSLLSQEKEKLPSLMSEIFHSLNRNGECIHKVTEQTTIYLKLCTSLQDREPPPVNPFLVPVFTRIPPPISQDQLNKMDVLSSKRVVYLPAFAIQSAFQRHHHQILQICPHIDGIRCIRDIANIVQIDVDLVGRCIRNLFVQNAITLLPMFLYSNTYMCTEKFRRFLDNPKLVEQCLDFVARGDDKRPLASDIHRLYLSLQRGICMRACLLWIREVKDNNPIGSKSMRQHRKIPFRKLLTYPIWTGEETTKIGSLCNGDMCIEDLALHYSCSPLELQRHLVASGSFIFIAR